MVKIVVVEDQAKWRSELEEHLQKYSWEKGVLFDVAYFDNGEAFLAQMTGDFDLVFMDIGLPGDDGIAISKKLREKNKDVCIVFLTELSQFAIQGYEVNAYDYLIKPMKHDLFVIKMDRILHYLQLTTKKTYIIKEGTLLRRISYDDILYIESQKHYIYFHCKQDTYHMRGSMDDIQNDFLGSGFSKINRSIFVNLAAVSNYTHTDVAVGDDLLPLSRVYKADFLKDLNRFVGKGH